MKLTQVFKFGAYLSLTLVTIIGIVVISLYVLIVPNLPSIDGLSDVKLQVPLRIYSSEGALLGEFGEKRRTPKPLDEIPEQLRNAFLAAEDDRFFEHPGVDYQGILRAAYVLLKTGERGQGGSTITMQLARNFYLSREKTYLRKLNEILLAIKIENELSKEKILELYLNKIYLGNRAYGVAAAAAVYYGKRLEDLTIPQIAMIAGLPKAPSTYNPIVNPERATTRRNYVLSRMSQLAYIDEQTYERSIAAPVTAERHFSRVEVEAPYVNEMVRAEIVQQFGDDAYSRGLNVYTTLESRMQLAANDAIWHGLVDYDRRHGFRGVVRQNDLNEIDIADPEVLDPMLARLERSGRFEQALIVSIEEVPVAPVAPEGEGSEPQALQTREVIKVLRRSGETVQMGFDDVSWARAFVSVNRQGDFPARASDVLTPGDVIWITDDKGGWQLGQIPEVQGALVALDPNDGAIRALSGGFNFNTSKFNRAIQSKRQAGSSIKPIIYTAAMDKGYTPATLINDAPVVFEDAALEGAWRPENYSGKFYGPTRLREALYKSRNLVSIRMLRDIGIRYATKYAARFGIETDKLPHDLSLALGSSELNPLKLARAYAVFANGGYLVKPHFIKRIEDSDGNTLFDADPLVACVSCVMAQRRWQDRELAEESLASLPKQAEQTLEPRLAYQMDSILKDVVKRGTGRKALQLKRNDIGGKTGTTNDQRDAWFNGYSSDLVAVNWIGFDQLKPLGNKETGSGAALPIWIDFMRRALENRPERPRQQPEGLITVKIDAETGGASNANTVQSLFETFRQENAPVAGNIVPVPAGEDEPVPEQLF